MPSNKKKYAIKHKPAKTIFTSLMMFIAVFAATSCWWALSQFADLNMEELVYELSAPLEGTGNGMIGDFFLRCFWPALIIFLLCLIVLSAYKKAPAFRRMQCILLLCSIFLIAVSAVIFARKVHLSSYIRHTTSSSDFIENHYVDPADTSIVFPEKKRNLIYIYLESVEATFTSAENGGAFENNYIPELTKLAQDHEDFSGTETTLNGGYSLPGTTWTIAGMFAESAALPLKSAMEDNSMSTQKSFFPNLTTLGDILEEEDYHQVLMLGSNATFGGRRVYYQDHGSFDIEDYNYALDTGMIPKDYKEFWGYEDEKLFSFAKERLLTLAQEDVPFNLTLLTVDTHMPEGYTCRLCQNDFGENAPYANALACSDRQISEFISWIQQQPFYENTTIILNGDHPTMATGFCNNVSDEYIRKTYTCVINPAISPADPAKRRMFTTFDLFPTTIAALGANIKGDRLGLGTNLFSAEETLSEQYGYELQAEEVSKNSAFLTSLEKLDDTTQQAIDAYAETPAPVITVRADENYISVSMPAIPAFDYEISKVFIKLWRYDGAEYVHSIQYLEEQTDGSWAADVETYKAKKFVVYDDIQYQMFVSLKGIGSFAIGQEGTLQMHA